MEKFLDFLSSNYLYFLIAAGVLFFALIGFVIDLKKKSSTHEDEIDAVPVTPEAPVETPVEVLANDTTPISPAQNVMPEPVETLNPAPPMPEPIVEPTPMPEMPDINPLPPIETTPTPTTTENTVSNTPEEFR